MNDMEVENNRKLMAGYRVVFGAFLVRGQSESC